MTSDRMVIRVVVIQLYLVAKVVELPEHRLEVVMGQRNGFYEPGGLVAGQVGLHKCICRRRVEIPMHVSEVWTDIGMYRPLLGQTMSWVGVVKSRPSSWEGIDSAAGVSESVGIPSVKEGPRAMLYKPLELTLEAR